MPSGLCTKWVEDKGFGFIRPHDGSEDLFVHVSELVHGDDSVRAGDDVRYAIIFDDRKGKTRAVDVEPTAGGGRKRDRSASPVGQDRGRRGDSRPRKIGRPESKPAGRDSRSPDRQGPQGSETGSFANWNSSGGYGFVRPDASGEDLFCHVSNLVDGEGGVQEGDPVIFQRGWNDRSNKWQALCVELDRRGGGDREQEEVERGGGGRDRGRGGPPEREQPPPSFRDGGRRHERSRSAGGRRPPPRDQQRDYDGGGGRQMSHGGHREDRPRGDYSERDEYRRGQDRYGEGRGYDRLGDRRRELPPSSHREDRFESYQNDRRDDRRDDPRGDRRHDRRDDCRDERRDYPGGDDHRMRERRDEPRFEDRRADDRRDGSRRDDRRMESHRMDDYRSVSEFRDERRSDHRRVDDDFSRRRYEDDHRDDRRSRRDDEKMPPLPRTRQQQQEEHSGREERRPPPRVYSSDHRRDDIRAAEGGDRRDAAGRGNRREVFDNRRGRPDEDRAAEYDNRR